MSQYTVDQNTLVFLHFEDGFKDECGRVWNADNGLTTSTANAKYGSGSVYFDGTTNTKTISTPMTSDLQLGSGPFTIDFWIKPESGFGSQAIILGALLGWEVNGGWGIYLNSDGLLGFYRGADGYSDLVQTPPGAVAFDSNWIHVAVVKEVANSANIKIYINGIKQADGNLNGTAVVDTTAPLRLGRGYETWAAERTYKGYVDEVRISNIARWIGPGPFDPDEPSTPAPTNLVATAGDSKVTLSWSAVTGATGYNVKRSTTMGGPYTTIASSVAGTSYEDDNVVNGTTYYYVVTAIGAGGESANSNEASATPQAPGGQELLRVTMIDSSEREFQLPATEVDGFVNWFNRTLGTGTSCYMLRKSVGSHNSKEYLAFDKIISFEVAEL